MEAPLMEAAADPEPQALRSPVPERALWMVMLTVFMDTFANSVLIPMLALYAREDFRASDAQIGYLFSAPCASAFLFAHVLARLTHVWGRKPVFVMSLLGMSVAALCQGVAVSYDWLLFGRTFGGLWIGITSTAKVYVNEVTDWDPTGNERSYWFAQMSLCQNVAKLFAPALGGALSHYGLNMPSLVTALVELAGAGVVYLNVAESPKFLGRQEGGMPGASSARSRPTAGPRPATAAGNGGRVLLFCCASMLTTACMKLSQTVFALFAIDKYGLGPIDIGFIYLLGALGTLLATRVVLPLNKLIGPHNSSMLASVVHALAMAALPLCPASPQSSEHSKMAWRMSLVCMVLCFVAAAAAGSMASAFQNVISGELDDQPTVQARGFMFRQGGQFLVPILATKLFRASLEYPWFFGALLALAAALPVYLLRPAPRALERPERAVSGYGEEFQDEQLTREQVWELGDFMRGLLVQKHLKWSKNREQVERLLERSVPEMPIVSRKMYYEALIQYAG